MVMPDNDIPDGFKETESGPLPAKREVHSQTSEVSETSEVWSSGFKDTKIGPIPLEWEVVRLGVDRKIEAEEQRKAAL